MDEKKQTIHARSKENGVVFYSNKFLGLCYEAYTAEDGAVQTGFYPSIINNHTFENYGGMLLPKDVCKGEKHLLPIKVLISIIGLISILLTHQISIAFALIYFWILVMKDADKLLATSWQIKCGKLKNLGRFHAAKHQVINAYEKLGRIPTINEVKKSSMLSKKCPIESTISQVLHFILLCIVIATCGFTELYVYMSLFALLVLSIILENKFNYLRLMQMIVLNKPTEMELKVVLEGLKYFEHMEENFPEEAIPVATIIIEAYFEDSDEDEEVGEGSEEKKIGESTETNADNKENNA